MRSKVSLVKEEDDEKIFIAIGGGKKFLVEEKKREKWGIKIVSFPSPFCLDSRL